MSEKRKRLGGHAQLPIEN